MMGKHFSVSGVGRKNIIKALYIVLVEKNNVATTTKYFDSEKNPKSKYKIEGGNSLCSEWLNYY